MTKEAKKKMQHGREREDKPNNKKEERFEFAYG
jgi:hypothetical protein